MRISSGACTRQDSSGRRDTADITEAAWELIRRDDVFDCTYEVGRPGTVMGLWKNKPLMQWRCIG